VAVRCDLLVPVRRLVGRPGFGTSEVIG